jgi:hypothetical protein
MAFTVTATASGTFTTGIILRVKVLTSAAAAQTGAAANAAAVYQKAITTTIAGSIVYGAMVADTTFTANASSTLIDNVAGSSGTQLGSVRQTTPTVTPGSITIGATTASGADGGIALFEIKPNGTIAEDASGPAVANSTTLTAITSPSFTPPAGSLLVAMVGAFGTAATITDTSGLGLTWTLKSVMTTDGYAAVWVAQMPAGGTNVALTTPNLALAAPIVTPLVGKTVALTTPNLALAAPIVTPAAPSGANVVLTTPNLALAAPVVMPAGGAAGPVNVNLTTPGLALNAPSVIPFGTPSSVFPVGDLDMKVELELNGAWTDISGFVFQDTTLISRGHPDESTQAAPSQFTGTLDNSDGRFSSLNPTGPYFGSLGLNTPIRVSIPEGSTYLRLQDQASYCSAAVTTPTSGLKVYIDATLDNWQASQTLAAQSDNTTGNNRCWRLETDPDGGLWFYVSSNGTAESFFGLGYSSFAPYIGANRRFAFTVAYDPSTNTATWYAGSTPLGASTYSTSTTIFASTAATTIGAAPLNTNAPAGMTGKVWEFLVEPLTGAVTADANFMIQAAGASSFTDAQGHAWTVTNNGVGEISSRKYRFHGAVAAWPQTWDPIGPNAKVSITAAGELRRMGRDNVPIDSAMFRASVRLTGGLMPVAYWPAEDGATSTSLASGIGGTPMWITGTPNLSSGSSFVCSKALPTMSNCAFMGTIPKHAQGTANVLRFLMEVPSSGDTPGVVAVMYTTGTVAQLNLSYNTGGLLSLSGYDRQANQLFTTGYFAFGVNGGLYRVSMEMTNSGSSINAAVVTVAVGADVGNAASVLYSGHSVDGTVRRVDFNPNKSLSGTVFGHVTVQEHWETLFDQAGPLAAWNGEAAGTRFARLCGEEGITFRGIGALDDTVIMSTQSLETAATLLQECVDADRGMWFETRQIMGFGYRTRVTLGNQYPAIALNYNLDQLDQGIAPTLDDQLITNDVTITSPSGATSRQVLDDGSPMSLGAIGRYDTSASINVQDQYLDDEANWIVHEGTVNEPRYPTLGIDLSNRALTAAMVAQVLDAEIGDRLTVANPPVNLPPGQIDQVISGLTETLSRKALSESYNGRPTTPWNVPYLDGDPSGNVWHVDTDGSSLTNSVTNTATSFQVTTVTGDPPWTTTGADFPFDISVGGERMTVTNITGASSPQTFTVTRSVNGVVKTHAASEDLRLYIPPIISL